MKTIIRVPTEQYAFIEQEVEATTPQEAVEHYRALQKAWSGGFGLEPKEWNICLDRYLNGKGMDADTYAQLSSEQQKTIQELKKAFKRINYKKVDEDESWIGAGPGKGENGDWSNKD